MQKRDRNFGFNYRKNRPDFCFAPAAHMLDVACKDTLHNTDQTNDG